MAENKFLIVLVNKDTNDKLFWTGAKFTAKEDGAKAYATHKDAHVDYDAAKDYGVANHNCTPADVMIQDSNGQCWEIPGAVRMDG